MVLADEEEVQTNLLGLHYDELVAQLAELEGKSELRVRATYEEEPLLREVIAEDQDVARLRESLRDAPQDATYYGRIQLGELVAQVIERKRERDAALMVDALAPLALALDVTPPPHARVVLAASFLVESGRIPEFDLAVDQLGEAQAGRMRFKYTGPLPPHSFVNLSVTA
jgi:hypothetical protein